MEKTLNCDFVLVPDSAFSKCRYNKKDIFSATRNYRCGIVVVLILLSIMVLMWCDNYCSRQEHSFINWFVKPCEHTHWVDCNYLRVGLSSFEFDRIVTSIKGNRCYVKDIQTLANRLLKVGCIHLSSSLLFATLHILLIYNFFIKKEAYILRKIVISFKSLKYIEVFLPLLISAKYCEKLK